MVKTINVKCPACESVKSFKVGADSSMATLKDVASRIIGEEDKAKLAALMSEVERKLSGAALHNLYLNQAVYLANIGYEAGIKHLFKPEVLDNEAAYQRLMQPPVSEKIEESKGKWAAAFAADGTLAYNAVYICPRCGAAENRLAVRVKYTDGGKIVTFTPTYRCNRCSSTLVQADDDNCGFVHEGLETTSKCDCGERYVVDSVVFTAK